MDGYMIVSSHQIDLGEGTTEKLVGAVMDMTEVVALGDGPSVECSVVDAGKPTVVLGHDV
jgi:hypothetical protein